jgi:hypothetical protein
MRFFSEQGLREQGATEIRSGRRERLLSNGWIGGAILENRREV